MTEITDFLLARIAEDELGAEAAKAAIAGSGGPWRSSSQVVLGAGVHPVATTDAAFHAEHIARFDPDRVIRECIVKRGIVAGWSKPDSSTGRMLMAAMAAVYSDHPDYKLEWRDLSR
ncbi:DUF6221 family protein [Paenarthrobacter sp. OM7]|uniref:DUF6221 family protein n=1 Tax=Paenarthrobacter sp. OM7 TaxID=3041264 RepID=UPI002468CF6E|nr:DUF6221 family protein [Paenarthrobacter sp. OM7]WGM21826.1 DUF6221 family protein [Paenarthrobacter sp. OM7]